MKDLDLTKQFLLACISSVAIVWIVSNGLVSCSNEIKTGNARYTQGYMDGFKDGMREKR